MGDFQVEMSSGQVQLDSGERARKRFESVRISRTREDLGQNGREHGHLRGRKIN